MMRSFIRWLQHPLHIALALCSLVPIYIVYKYIDSYVRRVPIIDQWSGSVPVAVEAARGTLSLDDLLIMHGGHWHFWNNLSTALLTRLNHWNIEQETWLNFIAAIGYCLLLIYVFGRKHPHLLHWVLVPFAFLIFYLPQQSNWVNAFYATWFYMPFFVVYAVAVIISFPVGWRPLIGAALCTIGASLSFGTGIPQWFVIPILLWTQGYRRWQHYATWAGIGAFTIGLYLYYSSISPNQNEWSTPVLSNIIQLGRFVVILIGAALYRGDSYLIITGFGAAGLLLIAANLYYLWSRQRDWQAINVWLTLLASALASGLSIAIGRVHLRGAENAIQSRYITVGMLPWLVLVALMVIVGWTVSQQAQRLRWHNALLYANGIIAAFMLLSYGMSTLDNLQGDTFTYGQRMLYVENARYTVDEMCILEFPLERHDLNSCRKAFGHVTQERAYQLAAYRLAVFSEFDSINILPETYLPGSPIIIRSPSRWLNVYIREWMLEGIDDKVLFHIAPAETDTSTDTFPRPLHNDYLSLDEATRAALHDFTASADQIWYISTPETVDDDAVIIEELATRDFTYTIYPMQDQRYRTANFTIYRFQKRPAETETVFYFGEEKISLEGWTLTGADDPQPCGTMRLQSWWKTEAVPQFNYSVTLVMVAPDGTSISQKDAAIGEIYMQFMEPGKLYFDERILGVPCDLAPGEYTLTLGIYHHIVETNSFIHIPAFDADGTPLGERAPLATFTVAE